MPATTRPSARGSVSARVPSYPSSEVFDRAADLFGVLSDPNRLRLLTALAGAGELCVGDLAAAVSMHESTTSHALRVLRAQRLVRGRRAGRSVYYRVADEHVRHVLADVLAHVAHDTGEG